MTEEEAVDLLAHQHGLLLMHGTPFGAPQYLRLSYGSIPPEKVIEASSRLAKGLKEIYDLAASR